MEERERKFCAVCHTEENVRHYTFLCADTGQETGFDLCALDHERYFKDFEEKFGKE